MEFVDRETCAVKSRRFFLPLPVVVVRPLPCPGSKPSGVAAHLFLGCWKRGLVLYPSPPPPPFNRPKPSWKLELLPLSSLSLLPPPPPPPPWQQHPPFFVLRLRNTCKRSRSSSQTFLPWLPITTASTSPPHSSSSSSSPSLFLQFASGAAAAR